MKNTLTYSQQINQQNILKLRELRSELPKFLSTYFTGIDHILSSRTKIAYATDLKTFFEYIKHANPIYHNIEIRDFNLDCLESMTFTDMNEYMEYLKLYKSAEGKIVENNERAIKRKMASVRSMYNFFHKSEKINVNPAAQVDMPRLHDKAIIRLDINEVSRLLDAVESGDTLSDTQQRFHKKNKLRDLAILTLMLGTGIRVSECVGLDLIDIDFNNDRIKVVRKGGYEAFVYFGDEVREALEAYLEERELVENIVEGHENALFLSSRKRRITVRSVEILVKKYARTVTTMKNITPHKLRSTYGTALYQQTGDIYLVADVLGHKDVNTTRKHYAAIEEERRKMAKDKVILRKEKE